MIKYPVKVKIYFDSVICVEDADGTPIANCDTEDMASTTVNSLNAMNEFPSFNHPMYFDKIVAWVKKWISPDHKYNVERNLR